MRLWTVVVTEQRMHRPVQPRRIMTMSISRRYLPHDRSVMLMLLGALDHPAAIRLHRAVLAEVERVPPPDAVVVDLTDVAGVDEAGARGLAAGNQLCLGAGVGFSIHGPPPLIRRLLDLWPARGAKAPEAGQPPAPGPAWPVRNRPVNWRGPLRPNRGRY
jgi:anti-anti-sigma regulatory factor